MDNRLSELYYKFNNFTQYRTEMLNSIDVENESLKIQIKQLELEKKQAQLEYDMKIHELKSQVSTTKGKARVNEELNEEKDALKQELYLEVVKHYENGMSARDIANMLGMNSTTMVYQAIKSTEAPDVEPVGDVSWTYFDNAAIHRYAVSSDRTMIKVHGTGDKYKIITVDGHRVVSGDQDVATHKNRIQIALEMFDGTYEGESIERPNPYRE